MRRAHDFILTLWVVALGADRVDLLGGAAPFVFTPFIALTPVVVASEWIRQALRGRAVAVPRVALQYAAVAAAFLATVWASVTAAQDPSTSASRAALLAAQVAGTWAVVVLASDRAGLTTLLARAAVVGIVAFFIVDALQLAALFGLVPLELRLGPAVLSLETVPYAGVIPRLSGLVADPNRTGWTVLVMAGLVALGEGRPGVRRLALAAAAVVIAFTLSRSTLLAVAVALLVVVVMRRRLGMRAGNLAVGAVGAVVAAGLAAALWVAPPVPVSSARLDAVAPLAERFSSTEGSASEHVMLLKRGLAEATNGPQHFLLGMGYGTGYMTLQDRFPGNRYANFHSIYVSLLAESGVFALLLMLVLLAWPLVRGGRYRALIAAAAAFNVFYQTTADPAFWLLLVLAWMADLTDTATATATATA